MDFLAGFRSAWVEMIDGNKSSWAGFCSFVVQAFETALEKVSNFGTMFGADWAKTWDKWNTGIWDEQAQKELQERNRATGGKPQHPRL